LGSNIYVVQIHKRLGGLFYPQAQQVCVKVETQYEG